MKIASLLSVAFVTLSGLLIPANAQVVLSLDSAASFAVLGSSTVTSTGNTVLNGDLGVSPGTSYTGFPPGMVVNGEVHVANATASQARSDATDVYDLLAGEAFTTNMSDMDLGGRTLTTGVYHYAAAAALTGILTLDAEGDPNARFDFQIGSTLLTEVGSQIILTNGALAENVYWQVGTSATFHTSSDLVGNFLAGASITANTGTVVEGRLFALSGAVTLDTNTISIPSAVPEPGASAALFAGVVGLFVGLRRTKRTPHPSATS